MSLHAVNLADRSAAVGRTLRDLSLPVDAAAVAVVREGHVVVPKEDTVFAAGDEVLVVTSEGSEGRVRELLVGEGPEEEPEDDEDEPEDDEDEPEDDEDEPEDDEPEGEPEPAEQGLQ